MIHFKSRTSTGYGVPFRDLTSMGLNSRSVVLVRAHNPVLAYTGQGEVEVTILVSDFYLSPLCVVVVVVVVVVERGMEAVPFSFGSGFHS
jgi:hypothetical protein